MTETHSLLPALRHALLPAPDRTLLMQACLRRGESARQAWQAWRAGKPSIRLSLANPQGARRLLPMLYRSARRNDFALEPELQTYLRTATLYEGLRSRTLRRICRPALAALAEADAPAITLRGVALAATVYERWSLRHCHDLDLFAPLSGVPQVVSALASAGFTDIRRVPAEAGGGAVLKHASRVPALVHTTLFEIPYYRPPLAQVWASSRQISIVGVPVRILAPEHMLAHLLGHAACSRSRDWLVWTADACLLIEGTRGLDWGVLEAFAVDSRLALPLAVMLDYLAAELGVAVPVGLAERLVAAAASEPAELDAALAGARTGSQGGVREMLNAAGGWLPRLRLMLRLAFPSPAYVRLTQPVERTAPLVRHYARRVFGYAARQLRAWVSRAAARPARVS